jgi:phosphate transport system substrate-binding protein
MKKTVIRPAARRAGRKAMSLGFCLAVALLGWLAISAATPSARAESLRIGGTGSAMEALRALAPAFKAETGIELVVVPNLGSAGAFAAVADGKLGLAAGGRNLRDKETARDLRVDGLLRTPFGFVTSRPGPDRLEKADILKLHQTVDPTWPDGMPVLLVRRPDGESDNLIIADHFPGMAEALARLRKRRDLPVAATDQDNADMAESITGSLTAATVAQVTAERRNLRFVSLGGVEPSLRAYLDGSYPYGKVVYLVVPQTPSAEATAFVRFIASQAARPHLAALGLVAGAR